mmetsp:Transcript_85992/g.240632  ORF Transcript_85992/g.240632 Transcript_85992/m.240632 type:complete len:221 (+) Transcript_85992:437-1099(+)
MARLLGAVHNGVPGVAGAVREVLHRCVPAHVRDVGPEEAAGHGAARDRSAAQAHGHLSAGAEAFLGTGRRRRDRGVGGRRGGLGQLDERRHGHEHRLPNSRARGHLDGDELAPRVRVRHLDHAAGGARRHLDADGGALRDDGRRGMRPAVRRAHLAQPARGLVHLPHALEVRQVLLAAVPVGGVGIAGEEGALQDPVLVALVVCPCAGELHLETARPRHC